MKLNYKRTILVGFAFFLISAFWQAYDAIVPLILTNLYKMPQDVSGFIMSLDNILAVFMLPIFGSLSDKLVSDIGRRKPFVLFGTLNAIICFIALGVMNSSVYLVSFVIVLLMTLIFMATFRSPAVALMPDVTIKPLRSKGNAIINLMGTAGGIIILVFGMIFKTGTPGKTYFLPYILAVCAVMFIGLVIFMFTVKENKWAKEMEQDSIKYGIDESANGKNEGDRNLSKPELKSLLLILASVALWYIGYNAVTSKYSVYATNILGFDYNLTLIIAQAAAVVAYIPVGIIASKIGRKKSILSGIVMLTTAFICGSFLAKIGIEALAYPIFALAGIGWATINVNSFPMVVELAKGGNVGKYTGYYYTASMSAQIVTPILSGFLIERVFGWDVFFPYAAIFAGLSFVTMFFVKHGDAKAEKVDALESLGGADD